MAGITRDYIDKGIQRAENGQPLDLPPIHGLSSHKVRSLLNWLCKLPGTNYLEIGTHIGSTLIPALWGNPHVAATCIDLWTGWEGAKRTDLESNLARHLPNRPINIIEGDMFTVDLAQLIPDVTVYFYDGPHSDAGHYQAFIRYDPIFADRFVALVDDWNWDWSKVQTPRAFSDLGYTVEASWELPATPAQDSERWWNGLYVAIVRKQDVRPPG